MIIFDFLLISRNLSILEKSHRKTLTFSILPMKYGRQELPIIQYGFIINPDLLKILIYPL